MCSLGVVVGIAVGACAMGMRYSVRIPMAARLVLIFSGIVQKYKNCLQLITKESVKNCSRTDQESEVEDKGNIRGKEVKEKKCGGGQVANFTSSGRTKGKVGEGGGGKGEGNLIKGPTIGKDWMGVRSRPGNWTTFNCQNDNFSNTLTPFHIFVGQICNQFILI